MPCCPSRRAPAAAIMAVYEGAFTVERKHDDSPLTRADLESQRIILEGLATLTPRRARSRRRNRRRPPGPSGAPGASCGSSTRSTAPANSSNATASSRSTSRSSSSTSRCSDSSRSRRRVSSTSEPPDRGAHRQLADGSRSQNPASRRRQLPLRVVGSRSHTSPQTAAYLARLPPHEFHGRRQRAEILSAGGGQRRALSALRTHLGMGHRRRAGAARGGRRARDAHGRTPPALQLPGEHHQRRLRRLQPTSAACCPRERPSRRRLRRGPPGSQSCKVASSSVGMSNTTSSSLIVSRATPAAAMSAAGT